MSSGSDTISVAASSPFWACAAATPEMAVLVSSFALAFFVSGAFGFTTIVVIRLHPSLIPPCSHVFLTEHAVGIRMIRTGTLPAVCFLLIAFFCIRGLRTEVDDAGETRGRVRGVGVDGVGGDRDIISDRESDQEDEETDDAESVSGHRNLLRLLVQRPAVCRDVRRREIGVLLALY